MIPGSPLVAVRVLPGHTRHQKLSVAALYVFKKRCCSFSAQHCGASAVVRDEYVVSPA